MAALDKDVAFCAKHGWINVLDKAEVVSGVFAPVCPLCAGGK